VPVVTIKISTNNLPQGYTRVTAASLKKTKSRIKLRMEATTKDVQQKLITSQQRASKTFITK